MPTTLMPPLGKKPLSGAAKQFRRDVLEGLNVLLTAAWGAPGFDCDARSDVETVVDLVLVEVGCLRSELFVEVLLAVVLLWH